MQAESAAGRRIELMIAVVGETYLAVFCLGGLPS